MSFSKSLCFAFYCVYSFLWFIQTIWDNSYPSRTSVVALFKPYCHSYLFQYISIDYEQFNALLSTNPSSGTFLWVGAVWCSTFNTLTLQVVKDCNAIEFLYFFNLINWGPNIAHKLSRVMPNCFIPTQRGFKSYIIYHMSSRECLNNL